MLYENKKTGEERTMKLSIIVPVYQVRPYLERCLKSILSQTFTDYEVILVDDGSTDGSQEICDIYANQYDQIRVIHKSNGGLSSARNKGIDVASGEYIMFVDSDDMIHVRAAELEINYLEEKNADAFICPLKRFRNDEEIDIYSFIEKLDSISVVSGIEVEKGLFSIEHANKYISTCGKVLKRSLFDDIRFPEAKLFEDEYTTYKLYYKCSKVVVVDTELYYYFYNRSGITLNLNLNMRFDEYDAKMERIDFFCKNGPIELYHLALLEFLRTAQWDIKRIQGKKREYDIDRGERFQIQYAGVLTQAKKEKLVSFSEHFDYFVLAYPEKRNMYRLKRIIQRKIVTMLRIGEG